MVQDERVERLNNANLITVFKGVIKGWEKDHHD